MKHLREISVKVIPHSKQRYNTVGDYFKEMIYGIMPDKLPNSPNWICTERVMREQVRISSSNADYEFLIAMHELIEWYLTEKRGISEKSITAFDKKFKGVEPGKDKKAPYHKEHMFAEKIERMLAKELKVNWEKYDKELTEK